MASEDSRLCCILEMGKRCSQPASATSLSKRAKRFLTTTKHALQIFEKVCCAISSSPCSPIQSEHSLLCLQHKDIINTLVPSDRSVKKARRGNGDDADPQVCFPLHLASSNRAGELQPTSYEHPQAVQAALQAVAGCFQQS